MAEHGCCWCGSGTQNESANLEASTEVLEQDLVETTTAAAASKDVMQTTIQDETALEEDKKEDTVENTNESDIASGLVAHGKDSESGIGQNETVSEGDSPELSTGEESEGPEESRGDANEGEVVLLLENKTRHSPIEYVAKLRSLSSGSDGTNSTSPGTVDDEMMETEDVEVDLVDYENVVERGGRQPSKNGFLKRVGLAMAGTKASGDAPGSTERSILPLGQETAPRSERGNIIQQTQSEGLQPKVSNSADTQEGTATENERPRSVPVVPYTLNGGSNFRRRSTASTVASSSESSLLSGAPLQRHDVGTPSQEVLEKASNAAAIAAKRVIADGGSKDEAAQSAKGVARSIIIASSLKKEAEKEGTTTTRSGKKSKSWRKKIKKDFVKMMHNARASSASAILFAGGGAVAAARSLHRIKEEDEEEDEDSTLGQDEKQAGEEEQAQAGIAESMASNTNDVSADGQQDRSITHGNTSAFSPFPQLVTTSVGSEDNEDNEDGSSPAEDASSQVDCSSPEGCLVLPEIFSREEQKSIEAAPSSIPREGAKSIEVVPSSSLLKGAVPNDREAGFKELIDMNEGGNDVNEGDDRPKDDDRDMIVNDRDMVGSMDEENVDMDRFIMDQFMFEHIDPIINNITSSFFPQCKTEEYATDEESFDEVDERDDIDIVWSQSDTSTVDRSVESRDGHDKLLISSSSNAPTGIAVSPVKKIWSRSLVTKQKNRTRSFEKNGTRSFEKNADDYDFPEISTMSTDDSGDMVRDKYEVNPELDAQDIVDIYLARQKQINTKRGYSTRRGVGRKKAYYMSGGRM